MAETLTKITVRARSDDRSRLQTVSLDGIAIGLRFRWSAYDSHWYVWVHAIDGSRIAGPRVLVPGVDLFSDLRYDPRIPPGQLFCYSPDREPPDLNTIDVSAIVFYRSA